MMPLFQPTDPQWSIPLRIGYEDQSRARFGGAPPEGVDPPIPAEVTRYFVTVPLAVEPDVDISVFLSFDLDQMLDFSGHVGSEQGLIQVVAHEPRRRGGAGRWVSEFPPHALLLGEVAVDSMAGHEGQQLPSSGHKIGGRPYFMHGEAIDDEVAELMRNGYRQCIQMGFPGVHDVTLDESWPFGDGVFHVLGREPFDSASWRWFWEN